MPFQQAIFELWSSLLERLVEEVVLTDEVEINPGHNITEAPALKKTTH